MGGNGSFSRGMYDSESERDYRTVYSLTKNIKVIALKKQGSHNRMPRTSHTANRVYVTMKPDGSGVREIAIYGKDHKVKLTIHTHAHKGITPHCHKWNGEKISKEGYNLTPRLKALLNKIHKMEKS